MVEMVGGIYKWNCQKKEKFLIKIFSISFLTENIWSQKYIKTFKVNRRLTLTFNYLNVISNKKFGKSDEKTLRLKSRNVICTFLNPLPQKITLAFNQFHQKPFQHLKESTVFLLNSFFSLSKKQTNLNISDTAKQRGNILSPLCYNVVWDCVSLFEF